MKDGNYEIAHIPSEALKGIVFVLPLFLLKYHKKVDILILIQIQILILILFNYD